MCGSPSNLYSKSISKQVSKIIFLAVLFGTLCVLNTGCKFKNRQTGGTWDEPAYLSFAGSNTIGDSLISVLVKSYLENIHATDIAETTEAKDEKRITATVDAKTIEISISAHGTKTGFETLNNNAADIWMASAPIDNSDSAAIAMKHPGEDMRSVTNEHVIGLDGIAVIVNGSSPVQELNLDDVRRIFSGEITNWNKIAGSQKSGSINIYRRDESSGTYKMFSQMAMQSQPIAKEAIQFEKSSELVNTIGHDDNAIGFVSYSFVKNNQRIKALAIKPGGGIPAAAPNSLTMKTERYVLCRHLILYSLKADQNPNVQPFLQYVNSKAGQDQVESLGFVSLTLSYVPPTPPADADHYPVEYESLIRRAQKLSAEFRFRFGSQELRARSKDDINRVVGFLQSNTGGNKAVILVGFTDNVGNPAKNKALSIRRARVVARQLSREGIEVKSIIGLGSALPVRNNTNELERSLNRRVEVWVTY